jgi:hypothetical protein
MKKICFIILLSLALQMTGQYRYSFSYTFKGQAHGRILLFIPYRVYYESSAAVNFLARKTASGNLVFNYDGIGNTGYMMRTSGYGGKTLAILTADYDFERSIPFGEIKLGEIEQSAPYYAKHMKRKKNFQFRILSRNPDSIRFTRSPLGVHSNFSLDFPVQFRYHPEILNIDFFIYPIMMELLKGYNHPCVPAEYQTGGNVPLDAQWESPPLDYSPHMNRIAPLAARVMKRLKKFNQKEPFQVGYRVTASDGEIINIHGESQPNIRIWGSFRIVAFVREVVLSKKRAIPLQDAIALRIHRPNGDGMTLTASLVLLD